MTGRMVSKWPGKCLECQHDWRANDMIFYNEGRVGYYCSESCARSAVEPVDAQTASNPSYTTPTADIAVNATQTIPRAVVEGVQRQTQEHIGVREKAIHEAHMENMQANADLVRQIEHLTAAINKIAKWLVDDAMANRGLKL